MVEETQLVCQDCGAESSVGEACRECGGALTPAEPRSGSLEGPPEERLVALARWAQATSEEEPPGGPEPPGYWFYGPAAPPNAERRPRLILALAGLAAVALPLAFVIGAPLVASLQAGGGVKAEARVDVKSAPSVSAPGAKPPQAAAARCPSCGKALESRSLFCPYCGSKVRDR